MSTIGKGACAAALLALLASPAARALEIITLAWHDAAEIAAALAPHLKPGESASGIDNRLLLDAPPARLRELTQLVSRLDTRPAGLRVDIALDNGHGSSSATIHWGKQVTHSGPEGNRSSPGGWNVSAGSDSETGATQLSLQLLDNHAGFIALGQTRPLPWQLIGPHGRVTSVIQYRQTVRGLYVRPHLIDGGQVRVEVSVRDDAFGSLDNEKLVTTVGGRLDEWLTVGSLSRDEHGRELLLVGAGESRRQEDRLIRLRVHRNTD